MLFALICNDKPGSLQLRMDTRPDHVAHLNDLNDRGILKFAGPFLDEDGNPNGSLVVVEAGDRQQAKTLAGSDPYALAGLFADVTVRPFNWTFNNPEN